MPGWRYPVTAPGVNNLLKHLVNKRILIFWCRGAWSRVAGEMRRLIPPKLRDMPHPGLDMPQWQGCLACIRHLSGGQRTAGLERRWHRPVPCRLRDFATGLWHIPHAPVGIRRSGVGNHMIVKAFSDWPAICCVTAVRRSSCWRGRRSRCPGLRGTSARDGGRDRHSPRTASPSHPGPAAGRLPSSGSARLFAERSFHSILCSSAP